MAASLMARSHRSGRDQGRAVRGLPHDDTDVGLALSRFLRSDSVSHSWNLVLDQPRWRTSLSYRLGSLNSYRRSASSHSVSPGPRSRTGRSSPRTMDMNPPPFACVSDL